MPQSCAAWGCTNRRTIENRSRGITFHRKTEASRKAEESWSVDCSQIFQEIEPPLPIVDHPCALPASPTGLKTRLCEALESLEHELRNVKDRERRAKKTVCDDLEDLSVMGFIINIDTLVLLIPELLKFQRYVCTYRFSQDHLEPLFNSIRASGGWNNNPTAAQFQGIFRHLMVRCGVSPSISGNVVEQNETVSLLADEMSSTLATEESEDLPSPFVNISALVCDHSYLPTRLGSLVNNALVYISGFVVRQILRKLSCDVCHASLVTDAVSASFDQSYHLLTLKNNGGLMIPSEVAT